MKHQLLRVLGTGASAFLALALIGTAAAQTTSSGPYYATPSWDQQLPTSTRFVVLSNWVDSNFPTGGAAVLDRETGLVWERSPDTGLFGWPEAQSHCNNLRVGNRRGWRLPTIQELASLTDPTVPPPQVPLPAGHPFLSVQGGFAVYWSATTSATYPGDAWVMLVELGFFMELDRTTAAENVWCVRSAHGVDAQ